MTSRLAWAALSLMLACAGAESPKSMDSAEGTDDTGPPADDSRAGADDTGSGDSDSPAPGEVDTGDIPAQCDGTLLGPRDVKLCGLTETQGAGYDLSVGTESADGRILVAAGTYQTEPARRASAAYVTDVLMSAHWLTDDREVSGLETDEMDAFGYAVEIGADLDGDGYLDLTVAAGGADISGINNGAILAYAGPIESDLELSAFDAALQGDYNYLAIGRDLVTVADVDADGDSELLVGVVGTPGPGLILGPLTSGSYAESAVAIYYNGDELRTNLPGNTMHSDDLDGDGVAEAITTQYATSGWYGAVFAVPVDLRGEIDLRDHVAVSGTVDGLIGGARIATGDANGDGYVDLISDTWGYTDVAYRQSFLMTGPLAEGATSMDASATFRPDEDVNAISPVIIAGDVDGDGHPGDIIASVSALDQIHLFSAPVEPGAYWMDAHSLIATGESADSTLLGWATLALPDLDGDGADELLLGAPFDDEGATDAGAVYTLFGGSW